jgi:hypothetical protein
MVILRVHGRLVAAALGLVDSERVRNEDEVGIQPGWLARGLPDLLNDCCRGLRDHQADREALDSSR